MSGDVPHFLELANRYTAAWCSGRPWRVASYYSEKGTLSVNGGPSAVGRSAIADLAQGFMTAFPDMQVSLDGLERSGEKYVYHWTLTETNTGPGGTGNPVRISGRELWTIGDDGLIAESLGSFDEAEYRRQLAGEA